MTSLQPVLHRKDFWSGAMFVAFGAFFLLSSFTYEMGSARSMGPGYFPAWLGAILIGLGAFIASRAFVASGEAVERLYLRPLLLISLAVLLFAVTVQKLGLPIAIILAVVVSGLARKSIKPVELAINALVLALLSTLAFVWALGLPFKVFVF